MEPTENNFLIEYQDIKKRIERVEKIIPEVIKVFVDFFRKDKEYWPYEVNDYIESKTDKSKAEQKEQSYSPSTNSMIMFTLAIVSGIIQESSLVPKIRIPVYNDSKDVLIVLRKALSKLVTYEPEFKNISTKEGIITYSYTFGINDPFTLSWFLELVKGMSNVLEELNITNPRDKLIEAAKKLIERVADDPNEPFLDWRGERGLPQQPEHVFPLLRIVQLAHTLRSLDVDPGKSIEKIHRYFNDCIHRHLSYSSIPDIGFDAAELMFSLEGSYLCKPEAFSEVVLNRVFEILDERQKKSPYWQPTKPFVASSQGEVLMPLSVEITNSLLRINTYVEKSDSLEGYTSISINLFRRYEDWLRSRMVRGIGILPNQNGEKKNFIGWQSEYIPRPGVIHLWETSQVLLFLWYYVAILQKYVARISLRHANLSVKIPGIREVDPKGCWDSVQERYEPLRTLADNSKYRIYERIAEDYLMPRIPTTKSRSSLPEMNYSMLIYGPPGTAKTTIVRELSKILGYPLIEITPSDFISGGEAQVETRARSIFQTLQEQSEVVIFFDEIDRMILDRDSKLYSRQGDVFQFMTPGMLTKFKDLRDKKKSIFVIATNYFERIDNAIKRKGRIDDLYLLLPPDAKQRQNILRNLIRKYCTNLTSVSDEKIDSLLEDINRKTALFVYDELNQLIKDSLPTSLKEEANVWLEKLRDNLSETVSRIQPTITLSTYKSRFSITADKPKKEEFETCQEPFEEFVMLAYLVLKANEDFPNPEDKEMFKKIILKEERLPVAKDYVRGNILKPIRDDSVKNFLVDKFSKWKWC